MEEQPGVTYHDDGTVTTKKGKRMDRRAFEALISHRNTKGRPKGSPDRIPGQVKAMVEQALWELGGVDYLVRQAHKHPVAFLSLLAKLIPTKVDADVTFAEAGELEHILQAGRARVAAMKGKTDGADSVH